MITLAEVHAALERRTNTNYTNEMDRETTKLGELLVNDPEMIALSKKIIQKGYQTMTSPLDVVNAAVRAGIEIGMDIAERRC